MDNFFSKLSLYDILSMVIPGGTIFLFLSLTLEYKLKINKCVIDPVLGWTIALVLSYLLGVINHAGTAILWKRFRNTPDMLRQSLRHVHKELGNPRHLGKIGIVNLSQSKCCLWCYQRTIILVCVAALLAVILPVTPFALFKSFLTILPFLVLAVIFLYKALSAFCKSTDDKKQDKALLKFYYSAYYFVADQQKSGHISIMESQVAFMQNMVLPLLLFLLLPEDSCMIQSCQIKIFTLKAVLFSGVFLMIAAVFFRQEKIYQCVWEDYEYLKRLEYEKNHK